jgi:hypothetical protein
VSLCVSVEAVPGFLNHSCVILHFWISWNCQVIPDHVSHVSHSDVEMACVNKAALCVKHRYVRREKEFARTLQSTGSKEVTNLSAWRPVQVPV